MHQSSASISALVCYLCKICIKQLKLTCCLHRFAAGSNLSATTIKSAEYPPYMPAQFCVINSTADMTNLTQNVAYACSRSDCTSLYTGGTCANLTVQQNASYAFNNYYQFQNQDPSACNFEGLAQITSTDPSGGGCRFMVSLIKETASGASRSSRHTSSALIMSLGALVLGFLCLP